MSIKRFLLINWLTEKYIFFWLLSNKKYAKKVPANFSSLEKPRKLDAAKINTFTLNADALSRIPEKPHCKEMKPDMDISKLPCGGFKYCAKAHQHWTVFSQDIDDVVPLGMSTHSEQ